MTNALPDMQAARRQVLGFLSVLRGSISLPPVGCAVRTMVRGTHPTPFVAYCSNFTSSITTFSIGTSEGRGSRWPVFTLEIFITTS